ncbi:lipopolysaccharide biosynthesis protein [Pseudoxanthomonas kalamensis DSM 18571]|uniref:MraY family glycosyltransferase n=1 Tax=Pseudoxanthomonas kalamensis TaxID=289483 RepID=UPI001391565C|nr:lipopolysaccharide biosynthesis protein [Pseudoxanthomonas kalamensis DSM 18571]
MGAGWTWIALHLLGAALLTAGAWRYALQRKLLDAPGERRSHDIPTPRGGGIAIVLTVLAGLFWLASRTPANAGHLLTIAAGLALVSGIGWVDDHRPLSVRARLFVHAIASLMLAWVAWSEGHSLMLATAAFLLSMYLINIWNFMDGIDGLATSQALIAASALACLLPLPWPWLAAGLAAACASFLPFNFPKARIFLGDVGSGSLGYLLAALFVAGMAMLPWASWPWLLLPASAFIVDAGFTLAWRMLNGQQWWSAHVDHLYQRWARRIGHRRVTLAYALFSMLATILCLAVWNADLEDRTAGALTGIWYAGAAGLWFWGHRKAGRAR